MLVRIQLRRQNYSREADEPYIYFYMGYKTKKCYKCKKKKIKKLFGKNSSRLDGYSNRCKDCDKQRSKDRRKENRQKLYEYLSDRSCIDCGEKEICALQFDHVKGKKYMNVSNLVSNNRSWTRVLKEIAKCEIVCANCHSKRTAKQQNWYINIKK